MFKAKRLEREKRDTSALVAKLQTFFDTKAAVEFREPPDTLRPGK